MAFGFGIGLRLGEARSASGGGDPNFSDVSLLLGFDGEDGSTNFVDDSVNSHTALTRGSPEIDTDQFQFGGSSLLTNNIGHLYYSDSPTFQFADGAFTLECWVRFTSKPNPFETIDIISRYRGGFFGSFRFRISSNDLELLISSGGNSYVTVARWTDWLDAVSAGTQIHVVAERNASGLCRVYSDGVAGVDIAATDQRVLDATSVLLGVGGNPYGSGSRLPGHIDELRVSKGVARYDGAFTPPTEPFPRS